MRESAEMYLETVLVLQNKTPEGVHAVDVARELGYSRSSVSIALQRLKAQGLLDVDGEDHIRLLPEGEAVARAVLERHQVLTEILRRLGVGEEVAAADACRIEHVICEETFLRLKEALGRLN